MKSFLTFLLVISLSPIIFAQPQAFLQEKFGLSLSDDELFDDDGGYSGIKPLQNGPGTVNSKILLDNKPYDGVIFQKFDIYLNNEAIRNGYFLIVTNGIRRLRIEFKDKYVLSIIKYNNSGYRVWRQSYYNYCQNNCAMERVKVSNVLEPGDNDPTMESYDAKFVEIINTGDFTNLISTGALASYNQYSSSTGLLAQNICGKNISLDGIHRSYHQNGKLNSYAIFPKMKEPIDKIVLLEYDQNQNAINIDTNFYILKLSDGYVKITNSCLESPSQTIRDEYVVRKLIKQEGENYTYELTIYNSKNRIEAKFNEIWTINSAKSFPKIVYDGPYITYDSFTSKITSVTNFSAEQSNKYASGWGEDKKYDFINGEQIFYYNYPDKIAAKRTFTNGQVNGLVIEYYKNGNIKNKENYVLFDGKSMKDGEQIKYYVNGKIELKEVYKSGKVVSFEKYYPNGDLLQKGAY
jgi:antitoxin component YwqK of YwqJK toxin-antitoxin module